MSGRPPLAVGTYGKVTVVELGPKLHEARTRYRDADGVLRRVKRQGPSKTVAEARLKAALLDRQHTSGATVTGSTKLGDAGEQWLALRAAEVAAGDLAPRTLATYQSAWNLHVKPALGALRLREVTTSRCEAWLQELRKHKGASMCKTARAVLSGVLGYCARMDAIPTNPVRDVSRVPGGRTRKPRAMTHAERETWLHWMDTHAAADPAKPPPPARSPEDEQRVVESRALGDVTRLLLATGARIGEVMALSWDEVDLEAGSVRICWHLVRVKGQGIVRVEGAKSEAGDRTLRLPSWAVSMLMHRRVTSDGAWPVFPDTRGKWRDPNQVMRWIRWSREPAGLAWVTSHVFRQTVITILDEAGLPTREVADQAGHSTIGQTQSYMARKIASERAAAALEELL